MKKILMLVTVFCLLFTGSVFANPHLCCDPLTDEVTRIDVELNGQLINVARQDFIVLPTSWCLVDLATATSGNYTARAKAIYGVWGESDWSADFLFVKPVIVAPVNTTLGVVP